MKILVILLMTLLSSSAYSIPAVDVLNEIINGKDFHLEVSKGNVLGHSIVTFNGHNDTVGTSIETLWNESGLVVFPAAASIMKISSDDANDTSDGTGLRTVSIQCLDSSLAQISEIVILNGLTAVNTVNSCLRINFMVGLTAGSGGVNAGHVYAGTGDITSGKPAVVVNFIDVENNLSDSGFFTVPASKDGYILNAIFTGTGNKTAELSVYTRVPGGLFLRVAEFDLDNGPVSLARITPFRKIPAGTDIELRTIAGTSADVKALVTMMLVNQ